MNKPPSTSPSQRLSWKAILKTAVIAAVMDDLVLIWFYAVHPEAAPARGLVGLLLTAAYSWLFFMPATIFVTWGVHKLKWQSRLESVLVAGVALPITGMLYATFEDVRGFIARAISPY